MLLLLLRRFTAELARSRHAVMDGDRIDVEPVGPSQCTKFHQDACEECRIFEGRIISPSRAVVDEKSWAPNEPSEKATRKM